MRSESLSSVAHGARCARTVIAQREMRTELRKRQARRWSNWTECGPPRPPRNCFLHEGRASKLAEASATRLIALLPSFSAGMSSFRHNHSVAACLHKSESLFRLGDLFPRVSLIFTSVRQQHSQSEPGRLQSWESSNSAQMNAILTLLVTDFGRPHRVANNEVVPNPLLGRLLGGDAERALD